MLPHPNFSFLENFPPELVNASSVIKINLNEMTTITLRAKDKNGDPFTFSLASIPGLQTTVSGDNLTIKWTVSTTNKVSQMTTLLLH